MALLHPAVFDCNVFLQAMLSTHGSAHACWQAVLAGKVRLYTSPFILTEVRSLPEHPRLRRFAQLTPDRVERFIEEIIAVAELVSDPPRTFQYLRDPDDAPYVDLALNTGAMLVVTNDRDLLDLMQDSSPEGKMLRAAHPAFRVITPPQFLDLVAAGNADQQNRPTP